MQKSGNFADYIDRKMANDPALATAVEEEQFNASLATMIYEARVAAGLSQKGLADLIGTRQSVISRLEDADYEGRSLSVLRKIAKALGLGCRVVFYAPHQKPTHKVPGKKRRPSTGIKSKR